MSRFPIRLGLVLFALNFPPVATAAPRDDDAAALRRIASLESSGSTVARRPLASFLEKPAPLMPRLSPDGRRVAFLLGSPGKRSLWLLDVGSGSSRRLLAQSPARDLHWSRDGRWLFLASEDRLSSLDVSSGAMAGTIMRLDDGVHNEILGLDRSRPDALLLLEQGLPRAVRPRSRLLRVDARGRIEVLLQQRLPIADAVLADDGRVAFYKRLERDRHRILQVLADGSEREVARCVRLQRCSLVGSDAAGGLLMQTDIGSDLAQLRLLLPDGRWQLLHEDPRREVDLDDVVSDPLTPRPRFAAYRSTGTYLYALDAAAEGHLRRIEARLPGRDLTLQLGQGSDARWLVGERDSRLPQTRWHLYWPERGELRPVALGSLSSDTAEVSAEATSRSAGESSDDSVGMARKWPIRWLASDGLRLHGYLSLPPGREPSKLPLVVSVHGGPWSAAGPEYSPETQLLVDRGHAVFEPNFRGSTGFGRHYLFAAGSDFGNGRIQRDIVEGTRFLLAHGIGDPARVAIIGASFGGYAALQGVTHEPDLFRLAIAAVAPTDFGWNLRWAIQASDLADTPGMPLATRFRMLGVDAADAATQRRLHAQSPLANATRLRRPVLLLAAGQDRRVPIRSVTHYAATLETLGRDVSLFIEPEAGHGFEPDLAREAYLHLLETALYTGLDGAAPPAPAAPALRRYLQPRLRLRGSLVGGAGTSRP